MERVTVYFNRRGRALGVRGSDNERDYEGHYSKSLRLWVADAAAAVGKTLGEIVTATAAATGRN